MGYAVVDMTVGGVVLPEQGVIVVQDDCMDSERALLGMNVIFQCWEAVFQAGHPGRYAFRSSLSPFAGRAWEKAFAACRRMQIPSPLVPMQGTTKLHRQAPVSVPPESELIVWACVPPTMCTAETTVLVEDLSGNLDGGREWRVARTISHVRGGKVPVRLYNPYPFPITLPQRQALATVSQIEPQEVQALTQLELQFTGPQEVEVGIRRVEAANARQRVDVAEQKGAPPALELQGDGLSPEEQPRLTTLLGKWQHVFAAHDEDFGWTKAVHHHIPTGSAPPIRERYKAVQPKLQAELRALLQGMLHSGVITEFESMGCPCSPGSEEEWHLKILCGLQEAQFDYTQRCLPPAPHRRVSNLFEERCLVLHARSCIRLLAG